jgi:hypothetical protein
VFYTVFTPQLATPLPQEGIPHQLFLSIVTISCNVSIMFPTEANFPFLQSLSHTHTRTQLIVVWPMDSHWLNIDVFLRMKSPDPNCFLSNQIPNMLVVFQTRPLTVRSISCIHIYPAHRIAINAAKSFEGTCWHGLLSRMIFVVVTTAIPNL